MVCDGCGWTEYYVVHDANDEMTLFICTKCKTAAVIRGGTFRGSFPKEALSKDLQML
jgi:hypothetical protein